MRRVSEVVSVSGMYIHAVADNINSGFLDAGDGIETGTGMVSSPYCGPSDLEGWFFRLIGCFYTSSLVR